MAECSIIILLAANRPCIVVLTFLEVPGKAGMILSVGPQASGSSLEGAALDFDVVRPIAHRHARAAVVPEASPGLSGNAPPDDDVRLLGRGLVERNQHEVVPTRLVLEAYSNAKLGHFCSHATLRAACFFSPQICSRLE